MSGRAWTPDQIPGLWRGVAVVTGANSGIGWHTALELARHGARVVLACRDVARGEGALSRIRAAVPEADVRLRQLDLADLASVRTFADQLLDEEPGLDILVNNAGVMAVPQRRISADGFEMQLAVNHLGHFALTGLLLPALLAPAAGPARVVSVSSMVHRRGRIDLADLQGERSYQPWTAYAQSKLANLLFAQELHRRAGGAVISVAAHPGWAATELVSNGPVVGAPGAVGRARARVMTAMTGLAAQPAAAGAWPSLYAATMPDVRGGEYFGPDRFGGWRGHPVRATATDSAYDVDVAAALWRASQELTSVSYEDLG
jgi:NAD(P)-dependent dehydrogenase (short-subunit alcohol dehydrogenase family)